MNVQISIQIVALVIIDVIISRSNVRMCRTLYMLAASITCPPHPITVAVLLAFAYNLRRQSRLCCICWNRTHHLCAICWVARTRAASYDPHERRRHPLTWWRLSRDFNIKTTPIIVYVTRQVYSTIVSNLYMPKTCIASPVAIWLEQKIYIL